jgi:[amino group carrier protein]-L-2-aminoadipate 6-kinase
MKPLLIVKLGGSTGRQMAAAFSDLAELSRHYRIVVVHGVSGRMAELSAARSMPVEMLVSPGGHSSRYTPPPVRDLFVEAAADVMRDVVAGLSRCGGPSVGMITPQVVIYGQRKAAVRAHINGRTRVVRDDYTGSITGIDADLLRDVLASGCIPVVPPLAHSTDGLLNIDGDRAAAAIAGALHAETLVILSNVRGLYRRYPDENSFVAQVPYQRLEDAMAWAEGRMKHKVLSAQDALSGGVQQVIVADGRVTQPVSRALRGEGTVFSR